MTLASNVLINTHPFTFPLGTATSCQDPEVLHICGLNLAEVEVALLQIHYKQELDDLLPALVIVFEAFKRSQNLKTWLHLPPQRLQSSLEAWGKKGNFS